MSKERKMPAEIVRQALDEQLERIRKEMDGRNILKVAEATGLHENTVRNIVKGRGDTPTLATIEKLGNFLFG